MACRLGSCEINNNRGKGKKPRQKAKKVRVPVVVEFSSEWSDSDDSCSGCSACYGSSSSCSCSECNMETASSDGDCCGYACGPKTRTKTSSGKKPSRRKVLQCKDGVCEWVSKKKQKKPTKTRKSATKGRKSNKC